VNLDVVLYGLDFCVIETCFGALWEDLEVELGSIIQIDDSLTPGWMLQHLESGSWWCHSNGLLCNKFEVK